MINNPTSTVTPSVSTKPVPGVSTTSTDLNGSQSIVDAIVKPYNGHVDTGVSHSGDLGGISQ